ncbi:MAG: ATP-dependent zinc protease [Thalassococcus sp.]|uniref:ATP-dependent zinc protease family protein n=1 Tax=Thalassococcus sp. TaxID=1928858 RepID=UPI001AFEF424|nr:RimK/LysX family protein [Thalassococcus sp.]MBO6866715.1 ATP-dependent zinc protease [Thalassococcus sp.]
MTSSSPPKSPRKVAAPAIIGWMEMVDLPLLGLHRIKAKIDTGARTTALHATDIEEFVKEGETWVRFRTQLADHRPEHVIEAPYHSERAIKNTSGIPEDRYIIRTNLQLGSRKWMIDLSVTDRSNMTFPMIIGRSALKNHNIAVHTRKTFQMTDAPAERRRKDYQ